MRVTRKTFKQHAHTARHATLERTIVKLRKGYGRSKEFSQYLDNPTGCAIMAASYGHLGQSSAGLAALAHYKRLTPQSLDAYARLVWQRTDQLKLFTDGIALLQIATA